MPVFPRHGCYEDEEMLGLWYMFKEMNELCKEDPLAQE